FRVLRLAGSFGSMSRRDGGFLVAVCLYVLRFCEAARHRIRLESRGDFPRLCNRPDYSPLDLPTSLPLRRSVWTSPSDSSLRNHLCLRLHFVSFVTCRSLAVLSNLFHSGLGG